MATPSEDQTAPSKEDKSDTQSTPPPQQSQSQSSGTTAAPDPFAPPPAAPIRSVRFSVGRYKQSHCPVCLEEYTHENPAVIFPCRHTFHLQCADSWYQRSQNCPVCLRPVRPGSARLMDEGKDACPMKMARSSSSSGPEVDVSGCEDMFALDADCDEDHAWEDSEDDDEMEATSLLSSGRNNNRHGATRNSGSGRSSNSITGRGHAHRSHRGQGASPTNHLVAGGGERTVSSSRKQQRGASPKRFAGTRRAVGGGGARFHYRNAKPEAEAEGEGEGMSNRQNEEEQMGQRPEDSGDKKKKRTGEELEDSEMSVGDGTVHRPNAEGDGSAGVLGYLKGKALSVIRIGNWC